MADSVVGALRIVLGADVASFEDGMKGAGKSLEEFSKQAKIAGAAIGAALSGAIIGLGISLKNAVDQADKLGKLSQSMGVPIEQLSQMSLAAQLSGVSIEALAKSFGILNKNMVDASGNAKTEAARAFQAMGISVKDAGGNLKSAQAVLVEMAGKFQGYSDGAAKSALATATLGKSGAALIPMLNEGADGLKRMMHEADELGLTIDSKTAKAASAFNDNLTLMGKIWDGIVLKIAANLLPGFKQFSAALLEVSKNSELMQVASDGIIASIKGAAGVALSATVIFQRFAAELNSFLNLMNSDNIADTKKFWSAFVSEGGKTKEALAGVKDTLNKFWADAGAQAEKDAETTGAKIAAPIISAARLSKNAVESFLSSQAKRGAVLQAEAATLTMTVSKQQAYRIELEAETIAKEKGITVTEALRQKIMESAQAYGAIAEATALAKAKFQELRQIGQDVGSAIAGSLQDAIKSGGKFLDVLKKLGMKLLDIAFQAAVTKPLQNIFGNLFSGGSAPVSPLFGFASGGSFNVGGSGGIDSQMVAFKASPNEKVTVSKPGQGESGGGQVVFAPQYTFAPGMTGNDMAMMKALVKQGQSETLSALRRMNRANSSWQFA